MKKLITYSQFPIILLAFFLRIFNLNARPFWYDEAFAVLFAEKGFSAMLYGTLTQVQGAAADVHPIIYYTGLNVWMQMMGRSPFAVRMLSVLIGLITIAVIYAIAREIFSKNTALVAMLFVAFSSFHVYYSQEARMYAPLALGCALVVLFFVKANRQSASSVLYWLGLSVSAAFAMYMQNLAAFFLLAFGLSTLARPKNFLKVAVAGGGAFILWLPWFINLASQVAKLRQAYWVTTPTYVSLLQTLLVYHVGEEFVATAKIGVLLPLFTGLVLLVMLVWRSIVETLHATPLRNNAQSALWFTILAFGTPTILFIASLLQPVYIQRALLPASLMYVLALSWLLVESKMPNLIRWVLGLLVGVTLISGLWAHYVFDSFPRPPFQSADIYLRQYLVSGDVIVHSNKLTFFPMYYYDRSLPQKFIADIAGSGSDTLAFPTQETLGLFAINDPQTAASNSKRVWFVIFDKAVDEYKPNLHPHLEWMQTHYTQRGAKKFSDMTIYEFVPLGS